MYCRPVIIAKLTDPLSPTAVYLRIRFLSKAQLTPVIHYHLLNQKLNFYIHPNHRGRDRADRAPAGSSGAPAGLLLDWSGGRAVMARSGADPDALRDANSPPHGYGLRTGTAAAGRRRQNTGFEEATDRLRLLHRTHTDAPRRRRPEHRRTRRRRPWPEVSFWIFLDCL